MYSLLITESYAKIAKRFFHRHPELLERYEKILKILCADPSHPSLRLHKLSGKHKDLMSVSITLSYRLIIHFMVKDKHIILVNIGSHQEVY